MTIKEKAIFRTNLSLIYVDTIKIEWRNRNESEEREFVLLAEGDCCGICRVQGRREIHI